MVRNKQLGMLLIALSGFLYSTLGIMGTWLIRDGFSVSAMLFWRAFGAALIILPWVIPHLKSQFRKDNKTLHSRRSSLLFYSNASLLYGFSSALYFYSSRYIGTGLGMVVFYTYPAFIFILLWVLYREKIASLSWVSLAMITGGMLFISPKNHAITFDITGIIFGILSSLLYALYIIASKRQSHQIHPWINTFALCLGMSALFLVTSIAEGTFIMPHHFSSLLIILALATFATAIPIFLMLEGLKTVSADNAAILSALEPVGTIIIGVSFLNERIDPFQTLGILIILSGAILATLSTREAKVSA